MSLIKLSRSTKAQVAKLLERTKAGTVTSAELNKLLANVEAPLKQIQDEVTGALNRISGLKRVQTRTLGTRKFDVRLKELRKGLKTMANHGDWPWRQKRK